MYTDLFMDLKDFINYGHSAMFCYMFWFIESEDKGFYCILLLFALSIFINLINLETFIDMEFLYYFYTVLGSKKQIMEPNFTSEKLNGNQMESSTKTKKSWCDWVQINVYKICVLYGTYMLY